MSSNKDFLPSSSPIPSICAIEIDAILFLFMMNCYKSSFQECITIIVLKIERTRNQPPYCLLQLQEKMEFHLPLSGCLGTPVTLPQSLYGRTGGRMDGWMYADVRTKSFRINGLPNFLTHGAPRAPLSYVACRLNLLVSLFQWRFTLGLCALKFLMHKLFTNNKKREEQKQLVVHV